MATVLSNNRSNGSTLGPWCVNGNNDPGNANADNWGSRLIRKSGKKSKKSFRHRAESKEPIQNALVPRKGFHRKMRRGTISTQKTRLGRKSEET